MKKHIALALFFCLAALSKAVLSAADASSGSQSNDYRLAPQDVISIEVFNEPTLSRTKLRVSNSGEITFPLLKSVKVAGKTQREIEKHLEDLLGKDYLVEPHVSVSLESYRTRTVSVLGALNKPGSVELPGEERVTIIDAIARAGGPTAKAGDKIEHIHQGKPFNYSYKDLRKEGRKPIYVEPGDVITIPESIF
jgi:polysaccharide biosynthesis/export protein